MANGIRLEFSSLLTRHPRCGRVLLRTYGEAAAVRLSLDPDRLTGSVEEREVVFGHAAIGSTPTREHLRQVSWATMFDPSYLEELSITMPEDTLSEFGAVALAALAISEFERAEIIHVLPKGSGGDYLVTVKWRPAPIQLEVSGIRCDDSPSGAKTTDRVIEKCGQVLRKAREGFVSVSTFAHRPTGGPYTLVGYVTRDTMGART
jgi:hypothetical protein